MLTDDRIPTKGPIPEPEKPTKCETETAEICRTTTSFGLSVSGTVTKTTTTKTAEQCATIFGCKVEDQATTVTTVSACTVSPRPRLARSAPRIRGAAAEAAPTGEVQRRADPPAQCGPLEDVVVFPLDPFNVASIRNYITQEGFKFTEVKSDKAGFTAYFYIQQLSYDQKEDLFFVSGVSRGLVAHFPSQTNRS